MQNKTRNLIIIILMVLSTVSTAFYIGKSDESEQGEQVTMDKTPLGEEGGIR